MTINFTKEEIEVLKFQMGGRFNPNIKALQMTQRGLQVKRDIEISILEKIDKAENKK